MTGPVERERTHEELEWARETFHVLVAHAAPDDRRRRTSGTRWSHRQLLFHMRGGHPLRPTASTVPWPGSAGPGGTRAGGVADRIRPARRPA
ncbi:hypothetical protein [Kocuria nitroreducens]|uniref:hypothetical protein n=1 Tax=Kocuria nitroreducens TaxID=3058914 RepID=UPI0036DB5876